MMTKLAVVMDTNVLMLANDTSAKSTFPVDCIENCRKSIEWVKTNGVIAIDVDYGNEGIRSEILDEYTEALNKVQPGEGYMLIKWIYDNIASGKVEHRKITPQGGTYKEFPSNPKLANFDSDDKKFVAVANADPNNKLEILEATDKEWWQYRNELKAVEIHVNFLCQKYISTP